MNLNLRGTKLIISISQTHKKTVEQMFINYFNCLSTVNKKHKCSTKHFFKIDK